MGCFCDTYARSSRCPRDATATAASRGRGTFHVRSRRELERSAGGHPRAARRARGAGPDTRRGGTRSGARAAAPAVPFAAAHPLYRPHPAARSRPARARQTRHPPRDLRALRRSPRAAARGPGARSHRCRLPPPPRPARRPAEPAAHRVALGARGSVAHPRRGPDRGTAGGAGARGPAHLRALVHARRSADPTAFPCGRSRPVRPSTVAGPRLHDRGRGGPAGLRPGEDVAAARPHLPRLDRRRDASVAESRRGPRSRGGSLPAARRRRHDRGLMTTGSPARRPVTILVVDDEAPLRRVLERAFARDGYRGLSVASAEEAYDLLGREQPDALLLDIHLPTMSGLSLYL